MRTVKDSGFHLHSSQPAKAQSRGRATVSNIETYRLGVTPVTDTKCKISENGGLEIVRDPKRFRLMDCFQEVLPVTDQDFACKAAMQLERLAAIYDRVLRNKATFSRSGEGQLDPLELRVLRRLEQSKELQLSELRRRTGWSKSKASSELARLEKRKLLQRTISSTDKRKHLVSRGERTGEVLHQIDELYAREFSRAFPNAIRRSEIISKALVSVLEILHAPKTFPYDAPEDDQLEWAPEPTPNSLRRGSAGR